MLLVESYSASRALFQLPQRTTRYENIQANCSLLYLKTLHQTNLHQFQFNWNQPY